MPNVLRTIADTLDGPLSMHTMADLYAIVATSAEATDPVVYTDDRVAAQSERLRDALDRQLHAARVIRGRQDKPQRAVRQPAGWWRRRRRRNR